MSKSAILFAIGVVTGSQVMIRCTKSPYIKALEKKTAHEIVLINKAADRVIERMNEEGVKGRTIQDVMVDFDFELLALHEEDGE